jgi:hypothetical protein
VLIEVEKQLPIMTSLCAAAPRGLL